MNKNDILKNFALGFIPLFIFILADEIWGTRIGLITAVVSGILQMSLTYVFRRQFDKMIAFDTGLIVLFGGISIFFNNDLFFKLKPAFVESIMLALFGVHAFSEKPVLLLMSKRYMGDVEFQPQQLDMMKKMSRLLFGVIFIHTALIVYSSFYMSKEMWAFISGGLFYILFALVFAGQWIYLKFFKKGAAVSAREEWVDIVTEEGKIIGKAPRSAVHGNPDLLHPVVHLHIFNRKGQLFLQKRSKSKDEYPGLWDAAVTGHISSGESIERALQREAQEEIGVALRGKVTPLARYKISSGWESELIYSFFIKYDGPFNFDNDEVETGKFWSSFELNKMKGSGIFTPGLEQDITLLRKIKML